LVTSESFGKEISQQHRKLLVDRELGSGAAEGCRRRERLRGRAPSRPLSSVSEEFSSGTDLYNALTKLMRALSPHHAENAAGCKIASLP